MCHVDKAGTAEKGLLISRKHEIVHFMKTPSLDHSFAQALQSDLFSDEPHVVAK